MCVSLEAPPPLALSKWDCDITYPDPAPNPSLLDLQLCSPEITQTLKNLKKKKKKKKKKKRRTSRDKIGTSKSPREPQSAARVSKSRASAVSSSDRSVI